jgi:hypothetical protein
MVRRACQATLLLCLSVAVAHAAEWAKYVAPDKSFSLHYPAGWKVAAEGSSVDFSRHASVEQLALLALPPDLGDTPRAVAEKTVELIRANQLPDLTVKEWRDGDQPASSITLLATYTEDGRAFVADVAVAKGDGLALWVSYTVPQADYAVERSRALLQGLLGSLAGGEGSVAPEVAIPDLPTQQADRNGRAFIFVLEFAMGAPFSTTQEGLILDAFKAGVAPLSAEQRAKFDDYPELVDRILKLGQDGVEPTRRELRQVLRDLLQESADNPVIQLLTDQLDQSAKVVAKGEPPLLQVAAQAMGEMLAFARLLEQEPQAAPDDLDRKTAATLRDQAIADWADLDADTKSLATSAPGMWMVVRTVLRTGDAAAQAGLREQLKALGSTQVTATRPAEQPAGGNGEPATGGAKPRSWVAHNTLMMMRQQTFNTYMWSRGYSGWTPMGKMW